MFTFFYNGVWFVVGYYQLVASVVRMGIMLYFVERGKELVCGQGFLLHYFYWEI